MHLYSQKEQKNRPKPVIDYVDDTFPNLDYPPQVYKIPNAEAPYLKTKSLSQEEVTVRFNYPN